MDIQFSQHCLWKRLSVPHCVYLTPLSLASILLTAKYVLLIPIHQLNLADENGKIKAHYWSQPQQLSSSFIQSSSSKDLNFRDIHDSSYLVSLLLPAFNESPLAVVKYFYGKLLRKLAPNTMSF